MYKVKKAIVFELNFLYGKYYLAKAFMRIMINELLMT